MQSCSQDRHEPPADHLTAAFCPIADWVQHHFPYSAENTNPAGHQNPRRTNPNTTHKRCHSYQTVKGFLGFSSPSLKIFTGLVFPREPLSPSLVSESQPSYSSLPSRYCRRVLGIKVHFIHAGIYLLPLPNRHFHFGFPNGFFLR